MSMFFTQQNIENKLREAVDLSRKGDKALALKRVLEVFDYHNDDGAFLKRIENVIAELGGFNRTGAIIYTPDHPDKILNGKFSIPASSISVGDLETLGKIAGNLAKTKLDITILGGEETIFIDPLQNNFLNRLIDSLVDKRMRENKEQVKGAHSGSEVSKLITDQAIKDVFGDIPLQKKVGF